MSWNLLAIETPARELTNKDVGALSFQVGNPILPIENIAVFGKPMSMNGILNLYPANPLYISNKGQVIYVPWPEGHTLNMVYVNFYSAETHELLSKSFFKYGFLGISYNNPQDICMMALYVQCNKDIIPELININIYQEEML